MAAKRLRSISDLTWQDALVIDLKSMVDRAESGMTISTSAANRILGLVVEYNKQMADRADTNTAIRDRAKKLAGA